MNPGHTKVIACAVVIEEMMPLMPPHMEYEVLNPSLHFSPTALKSALQNAINASAAGTENILLGYGLCSKAVVGLRAEGCTLVVPRVDDCIAIFLGSQAAYMQQLHSVPGTYYLTKGWMKEACTPFDEYDILVERYGEEKARWLMSQILKHFTRLAFIKTGPYKLEDYRVRARGMAERFSLHYEEIQGSNALIKKMLYGPWDDDFVIAAPGETISFLDFKKVETSLANVKRKSVDTQWQSSTRGGPVYGSKRLKK